MIYTMNGMATELNLHADEPGTFPGLSAHYSGEGFSDMHFDVRAVPPDQFTAWVETTRNSGPALNAAAYAALAKQSINAPVSSFSAVDADLFAKIVTQKLPPSAGPQTHDSGAHQTAEE
jgi:cytochrome o ubiquinol oxidase subunit 2